MRYRKASQVYILFLITLNFVLFGVKVQHTKLERGTFFFKEAKNMGKNFNPRFQYTCNHWDFLMPAFLKKKYDVSCSRASKPLAATDHIMCWRSPKGKQTTGKHLSGCKNMFPLNMQVYFSSCNKVHLFDAVSDSFIVFVHILTNLQDWVICNGSHRSLVQINSIL